jgi:hypothetical protein
MLLRLLSFSDVATPFGSDISLKRVRLVFVELLMGKEWNWDLVHCMHFISPKIPILAIYPSIKKSNYL